MKKDNFDEETAYKAIFEIVRKIPKGKVTTYGAIAKALGLSTARIVGHAMGTVKITQKKIIPVQRVVSAGGKLSGDNGYREDKLKSEGVEVKNERIINFKKIFWDPMIEL